MRRLSDTSAEAEAVLIRVYREMAPEGNGFSSANSTPTGVTSMPPAFGGATRRPRHRTSWLTG